MLDTRYHSTAKAMGFRTRKFGNEHRCRRLLNKGAPFPILLNKSNLFRSCFYISIPSKKVDSYEIYSN